MGQAEGLREEDDGDVGAGRHGESEDCKPAG
jgi:hypothetical protein